MGAAQLDGDGAYLVEMRPAEGARNVIVRLYAGRRGARRDRCRRSTPAHDRRAQLQHVLRPVQGRFNVRTRCARVRSAVAACASGAVVGVVWFANFAVPAGSYRQETSGPAPVAITPLRVLDTALRRRHGGLAAGPAGVRTLGSS